MGGPLSNQTILRGCAPQDSLISLRTSLRTNLPDNPVAFPLFVPFMKSVVSLVYLVKYVPFRLFTIRKLHKMLNFQLHFKFWPDFGTFWHMFCFGDPALKVHSVMAWHLTSIQAIWKFSFPTLWLFAQSLTVWAWRRRKVRLRKSDLMNHLMTMVFVEQSGSATIWNKVFFHVQSKFHPCQKYTIRRLLDPLNSFLASYPLNQSVLLPLKVLLFFCPFVNCIIIQPVDSFILVP